MKLHITRNIIQGPTNNSNMAVCDVSVQHVNVVNLKNMALKLLYEKLDSIFLIHLNFTYFLIHH